MSNPHDDYNPDDQEDFADDFGDEGPEDRYF